VDGFEVGSGVGSGLDIVGSGVDSTMAAMDGGSVVIVDSVGSNVIGDGVGTFVSLPLLP
jgi:hypothetical protein